MAKVPIIQEVQRDTDQIGDVKYSILDEATFQSLRGDGWVLMDGQDVTGSQYAILTGNTVLPDARGRYLRAKDHGAGVDTDGDQAIGTEQNDTTRRPRNTALSGTTDSDSHSHTIRTSGIGSSAHSHTQGTTYVAGETSGTKNNTGSTAVNSDAHSHTYSVTGGGDAETRPYGLVVNVFIKVN